MTLQEDENRTAANTTQTNPPVHIHIPPPHCLRKRYAGVTVRPVIGVLLSTRDLATKAGKAGKQEKHEKLGNQPKRARQSMERDGVPGPVWPSGVGAGCAYGLRKHYAMTYVKRYVIRSASPLYYASLAS